MAVSDILLTNKRAIMYLKCEMLEEYFLYGATSLVVIEYEDVKSGFKISFVSFVEKKGTELMGCMELRQMPFDTAQIYTDNFFCNLYVMILNKWGNPLPTHSSPSPSTWDPSSISIINGGEHIWFHKSDQDKTCIDPEFPRLPCTTYTSLWHY